MMAASGTKTSHTRSVSSVLPATFSLTGSKGQFVHSMLSHSKHSRLMLWLLCFMISRLSQELHEIQEHEAQGAVSSGSSGRGRRGQGKAVCWHQHPCQWLYQTHPSGDRSLGPYRSKVVMLNINVLFIRVHMSSLAGLGVVIPNTYCPGVTKLPIQTDRRSCDRSWRLMVVSLRCTTPGRE